MDYTNKALGLRVQTQIPLNVKSYCESEDSLKDLGLNNNLAYIYEKGLIVYCILEGTRYEWKEIEIGDVGLLPINFLYPDNVIIFGIDYSNKEYNFVLYDNSSETPDATSIVKGKLKLTNDLGGTADLPTTPTAIHKTGDETGLTGIKTWTNVGSTSINGINLISNGGGDTQPLTINIGGIGVGAKIINTVGGEGLKLHNLGVGQGSKIYNENIGIGSFIFNNASGIGVWVENKSSGVAFVSNGLTATTGNSFEGRFNNVINYFVDKFGNITANKYVKTGGTAQQILIADGTVRELNPQKEITADYILTNADDGYVVFINNSTTPITVTINTTVTIPNFSVGFIQEGTADVTFVGTGITLTNPIGLKSKGQGYQTFIERKLSTTNYYLLGNTKI